MCYEKVREVFFGHHFDAVIFGGGFTGGG